MADTTKIYSYTTDTLAGKMEINDTPMSRNDMDTQITNALGNPQKLEYSSGSTIKDFKEGAKFSKQKPARTFCKIKNKNPQNQFQGYKKGF